MKHNLKESEMGPELDPSESPRSPAPLSGPTQLLLSPAPPAACWWDFLSAHFSPTFLLWRWALFFPARKKKSDYSEKEQKKENLVEKHPRHSIHFPIASPAHSFMAKETNPDRCQYQTSGGTDFIRSSNFPLEAHIPHIRVGSREGQFHTLAFFYPLDLA